MPPKRAASKAAAPAAKAQKVVEKAAPAAKPAAAKSGKAAAKPAAKPKAAPKKAKAPSGGAMPKNLDLFAALKRSATDAELLATLAASPGAAKEEDKYGDLPLHCAVFKGASAAVVAALLQPYPEAT